MHRFALHLGLFLLLNICLYMFISLFHSRIPFNTSSYSRSAHHFIPDPRAENKPFNLFSALAQYDSQWYLKIAAEGYTYSPAETPDLKNKTVMGNLTYNFFPFYPFLIKIMSVLIPHPELAAFVLSLLLILIGFSGLYYFAGPKPAWLLFLFPVSIYFRSYYTESVLLILSVWTIYFLIQNKYFPAAFCLALLNITKGRAFPLDLIFLVVLIRSFKSGLLTVKQFILNIFIAVFPLTMWILFNHLSTGNPLYFVSIASLWQAASPLHNLINTLILIFNFYRYPFMFSVPNQSEIMLIPIVGLLLIISKKRLDPLLWWFALLTFLLPLITLGPLYFTRFQITNFPIFIVLADLIPKSLYPLTLVIFSIALFTISLYFINWYWMG